MLNIFFFLFGSILASFLNLCVYRIEKEYSLKSILIGKSFCENCKKELNWYQLIPIFSFIFLKRKCPSCKKNINSFYFFSELLLALSFLFLFINSFPIPYYIFLLILYFWSTYDFFYQSIPKKITDVILIVSFFYWILFMIIDFDLLKIYPLVLTLIIFLIIFLISLKKKVFGLGDGIVLIALAFWFDLYFFLNIVFLSIAIGGLFSMFLVLKDKNYLKKYIPFLPFLFFGFLFSLILKTENIFLFDYIFPIW